MKYIVEDEKELKIIKDIIKKHGIEPEGCIETAEICLDIIRFKHLKTFKEDVKILLCKSWDMRSSAYNKKENELIIYFKNFIMIFPDIKSYTIQILEDEQKQY